MHISIDIFKVFDKPWLVAISQEQRRQFFVIHAPVNRSFTDLETIDMNYGQDRARLFRIDVLGGVPAPAKRVRMVPMWKKNMSIGLTSLSDQFLLHHLR